MLLQIFYFKETLFDIWKNWTIFIGSTFNSHIIKTNIKAVLQKIF